MIGVPRSSRIASFLPIGIWLGAVTAPSQEAAAYGPTLQLEKTIYVAGESVRFWVGVTSELDIPESLQSSCILHIVRPDGGRIDERVSWPLDGMTSRGWKGGWGFGKESPGPGRYVVSFEFAGHDTGDQAFEIVANPIASQIEARWIFYDASAGGGVHGSGARLHVENKTGRLLRFAKPGLPGSEVWLTVKTFQPPSLSSTFVPQSALLRANEIPSFSLERLDWRNETTWPTITVPDAASVDRDVELQSAYSFREGRDYEIAIETVLIVFAGGRNDPDAQLFPLRIPVTGSERIHW